MSISSINTNLAAYYAQVNISAASDAAALSVARLSSGNRIIRASDDVAGLAIGTSLAIGVSVFKTALTSASQGNSLLQVADGAVAQISDILSRQKAIAAQAGSGSLSDTERAYLNQEFQSLTQEIDQISSSTTFSGVKLINGDISGSQSVSTNNNDSTAVSVAGASSIATFDATTQPANGDTMTIQGVTITFTSSDQGTTAAAGKVSVGSSGTNTAFNVAAYLNHLASTDGRLANLEFVASGATVLVRWTGGLGAGSVSVNVSSNFTTTANTSASTTIQTNAGSDGLGVDRFSIVGSVTGSVFVDGGTNSQELGQAIDLSGLKNNADFIGKFGQGNVGAITGTYSNAADTATFSVKVGDITYATTATDVTSAGNVVSLTFTGANQFGSAAGGSFVVKLNGSNTPSFNSQAQLDNFVNQINNGLAGVSIQQNRDVTGVANSGQVVSGGVEIADTTGLQFDLRNSDFTNVQIKSLTVSAPTAGGTDAVFEAVINGETYRSVAGIGNQIGKNTVIALQDVNDSSKVFTITTGNTGTLNAPSTTMDLSTQSNADAVAASLSASLGIGAGGTGLQFQVGDSTADQLNVTINDASSNALFGGQSLDVLTQDDAATASSVLDSAVTIATGIRANIGALESRFGFATANIQTAIQNEDAARSQLLDTDIPSEATAYSTAQVKLQAGISVLAQANQQLQSLLKLIG
jgi:flagellin